MSSKKNTIEITLPLKIYKYITKWAEYEKMTLSEVIEYIITEYTDESNKLSDKEELIVNAYRYGDKNEKDILWKAWYEVDTIARKRRTEEEKEAITAQNKIININQYKHNKDTKVTTPCTTSENINDKDQS